MKRVFFADLICSPIFLLFVYYEYLKGEQPIASGWVYVLVSIEETGGGG